MTYTHPPLLHPLQMLEEEKGFLIEHLLAHNKIIIILIIIINQKIIHFKNYFIQLTYIRGGVVKVDEISF